MAHSSTKRIAYDLRPGKQTERRIVLDVLEIARESGYLIRDYHYIGLGGVRFYDFVQIHKSLGISKMTSLEKKQTTFERASYNVPYSFIKVKHKTTSDFIAEHDWKSNSLIWMDYDGTLTSGVLGDIDGLGTNMIDGDFLIVTVSGSPPSGAGKSDSDRMKWAQETYGDLIGEIKLEEVERQAFPNLIARVLTSAMINSMIYRQPLVADVLFCLRHDDGLPMVTAGVSLSSGGRRLDLKSRLNSEFSFLAAQPQELFRILTPPYTQKERQLLDRTIGVGKRRTKERNQLLRIGIVEAQIEHYQRISRFLPRYVETVD